MSDGEEEEFTWAAQQMEQLLGSVKSCLLATVSYSGVPLQSYAPVHVDERRCFRIYVSSMAKHYSHLKRGGIACLSLMEDEAAAETIFARRRLTVDCSCAQIDRASEAWSEGMAMLEERHGETLAYLRGLKDFDLFELTPKEGRLVLGFGKAYRVFGSALDRISYLGAGGHRKDS